LSRARVPDLVPLACFDEEQGPRLEGDVLSAHVRRAGAVDDEQPLVAAVAAVTGAARRAGVEVHGRRLGP
jgi:hypothetical protein